MRPLTDYDERAFARWIRGHAEKKAAERRARHDSTAAKTPGQPGTNKEDIR